MAFLTIKTLLAPPDHKNPRVNLRRKRCGKPITKPPWFSLENLQMVDSPHLPSGYLT
jgi:hypothetical protein